MIENSIKEKLMNCEQFDYTDKALRSLLAFVRNDSASKLVDCYVNDPGDWEKVVRQQKLCYFIANTAPHDHSAIWKELLLTSQQNKRMNIAETLRVIAKNAVEINVKLAVIKGIAFEKCIYDGIEMRDQGDIDLLIDSKDAIELHKVLIRMGYQQRIGPSSSGSSKAIVAICAMQDKESNDTSSAPIRRHPLKKEYAPYIKPECPTIEVHDGFYGLSQEYTHSLIEKASNENNLLLDPITNFILLIANTYENSESFYSNAFDQGIVLRDYIDLRQFFIKYNNQLDWTKIEQIIDSLGMNAKLGTVLENLEAIYGNSADCGCLPQIMRLQNMWGIDVVERMCNTDIAKHAAVMKFRENLRLVAKSQCLPIISQVRSVLNTPCHHIKSEIAGFQMNYTDNLLTVIWSIEDSYIDERFLFQVSIFPLTGEKSPLAYKIDFGLYDGKMKAYGHCTKRLMSMAAVKRKTIHELPFEYRKYDNHINVVIKANLSKLGLIISLSEAEMAISAGIYKKNYGNIFWDMTQETTTVLEDVEWNGRETVQSDNLWVLSSKLIDTSVS
jgi:hypothetical protein